MNRHFYLVVTAICAFTVTSRNLFKGKGAKGLPDDGQLHGVAPTAKQNMNAPRNMVYIQPGTFHMGPSDEDISYQHTTSNTQVSIPGYWMDATEITNDQYRQFDWVS